MASSELIEALETVYELADGNVLDFDDDDAELKNQRSRQLKALQRVKKFIDNLKVNLDNLT